MALFEYLKQETATLPNKQTWDAPLPPTLFYGRFGAKQYFRLCGMTRVFNNSLLTSYLQYWLIINYIMIECTNKYRIAGNFRGSKFSRKSRFPLQRNFRGFNFRV